ncbi:hypothetical protein Agub_g1690, partial [Astrephomene gubernaculifera]
MSGRGGGRGRISSLQAFDANEPGGGGRYGGRGGGRGRGRGRRPLNANLNYMPRDGGPGGSEEDNNIKLAQVRAEDVLDEQLGFPLFTTGDDRLGWLMNIQSSHMAD